MKLAGHVRRGIVVGIVLTVLNVLGSIVRFGPPDPSMDRITWNSVLGTSFLGGFIEEIPYRGFMLQKFAERLGFWGANLITSLLFLAIHIPGWIALDMLHAERAASVFILGLVMAAAVRFSGSLWAPIVAHSANNGLSFVLLGR